MRRFYLAMLGEKNSFDYLTAEDVSYVENLLNTRPQKYFVY